MNVLSINLFAAFLFIFLTFDLFYNDVSVVMFLIFQCHHLITL